MSEVIGLGMEYMVTIKRFDNKNLHKWYFQAANSQERAIFYKEYKNIDWQVESCFAFSSQ